MIRKMNNSCKIVEKYECTAGFDGKCDFRIFSQGLPSNCEKCRYGFCNNQLAIDAAKRLRKNNMETGFLNDKEYLIGAAIKVNEKFFEGMSHSKAYEEYVEQCHEMNKKPVGYTEVVFGFLTSKNRFVDRKEAAKIAFEAKQINKPYNILESYMIKKWANG